MRKFVIASVSLYVAGAIGMLGLLSNWFRYGLSLEAMTVATVGIIGGIVVLAVATVALKRPGLVPVMALCTVTIISTVLTMLMYRDAFGSWIPPLRLHHVEASGYATLDQRGQALRYELELQDPFSSAHKEYLVLNRLGQERKVRLPIFDEIPSGYTSPAQPADWIVLLPTDNGDVFIAEIGSCLSGKRFNVNLMTGEVTLLPNHQAIR